MNEIREKKYAVILGGNRITDYVYDDVIQTKNTLYGIKHVLKGVSTVHAYSKEDGRVVFKMELVENYAYTDHVMIIKKRKKLWYVYFDSCQKVKGPFSNCSMYNDDIIVSKEIAKIVGYMYAQDEVFGMYNKKGEKILAMKYEQIIPRADGIIEVVRKQKSGLVNVEGKWIIKPIYFNIKGYFDNSFITFYDEKKDAFGAMDKCGKLLLQCEYDKIEVDEKNGLIYMRKDALYGLCKHNQGVIFTPTFRSLEKNQEVIELIGIDNKTYGYIHKLDLLLPRRYYTYYENYLKYFDGYKWRKLKYNER